MNFLNKYIPWFGAGVIFILVENLIKQPKQVYWLVSACFILIILLVLNLTGWKLKNGKFWRLIVTPVLFLAGGLLFLSFLSGLFLRQFLIIVLAVFIGIFLEVIFLWLHARPRYQAHSLENILTNMDLMTIFSFSAGFFNLVDFLGISSYYLTAIFLVIVSILTYQMIWISGSLLANHWPYLVVISLVTTEIFYAVTFLPTSVYVSGLLVGLSYYLMTGLAKNWLLGIKEGAVVKRYLFISLIALVVILVTAKWI